MIQRDLPDRLIEWYRINKRDLPWREVNDPYRIWVSEIILQQTRVAQGMDYYYRFIETFPTIVDLANAPLERVLKIWQGLGYYARARNMHCAAQTIRDEHNGKFPDNYSSIRKLKGVGDYTAAAIASFAFRLHYATVDGNVYRVLSRLFDIETPIDSTHGKKEFAALAQELLHDTLPDQHNQAIMELGALCCTPHNPTCSFCPWMDSCQAFAQSKQNILPIKEGKVKVQELYLYYFDIRYKEGVWMKERTEGGVWKGLYEFPVVTSSKPLSREELMRHDTFEQLFSGRELIMRHCEQGFVHRLSHRTLKVDFYQIEISEPLSDTIYRYVREKEVEQLPVSRLMHQYLKRHLLSN